MTHFRSTLNKNTESYSANRRDMLGLIDTLAEIRERAVQLSEKRRPRFEQRGQLTPRERLQRLLDPGMP
ncbi:MAG: geranyl-CoA carboxylase beta subunit, partial [Bacteroidia bacterium]